MPTVAGGMLEGGPELHALGMRLEMALRVSTADHVKQALRLPQGRQRDWAANLHLRWGTFDDCFRWAATSAAGASLMRLWRTLGQGQ